MKRCLAALAVALPLAIPSFACAATDPGTRLPVIPGAVKLHYQMLKPTDLCGHRETVVTYAMPDAKLSSVVAWYRQALPGATEVSHSLSDPGDSNTQSFDTFLTAGGATAVGLIQTTYGGAAARLMAQESRKVIVGFSQFSPPIGADVLRGEHCSK